MKVLFAVFFLVSSVLAQDQAAIDKALAACGPVKDHFYISTDDNQHPLAKPESGKATVYIIQDGSIDCFRCATTFRTGLDGVWVGATWAESYFFFNVEPGEHHLCVDRQRTAPNSDRNAAFAPLDAEAGKTYYFRLRVLEYKREYPGRFDWKWDLDPINPDEGQFLVAWAPFSNWSRTKPRVESESLQGNGP